MKVTPHFWTAYFTKRRSDTGDTWYGWEMMDPVRMLALLKNETRWMTGENRKEAERIQDHLFERLN